MHAFLTTERAHGRGLGEGASGGWDGASAGVLSRKSISVHDPSHLSVNVPQMAGFDILSAQAYTAIKVVGK